MSEDYYTSSKYDKYRNSFTDYEVNELIKEIKIMREALELCIKLARNGERLRGTDYEQARAVLEKIKEN